ncbi:hypothetical protein C1I98_36960 [Spongiactinospora gelatinilytica]|uniref:YHS domain-containing protein n=1 Tax=Spongiactinospora gelatinilytica TaxID=2666298 RepID=A0A2W2EBN1_9ACTN|nr:hypothetical protein [Spongiactinospora gelatinilytica]PZG21696.1 hypothetical protein C1I98_36960 [Spongiactinospora gelatinilytica]
MFLHISAVQMMLRDRVGATPLVVSRPYCGMGVDLGDSAVTLVHEGVLYGFCHGLCRRAFADQHGLSLSK